MMIVNKLLSVFALMAWPVFIFAQDSPLADKYREMTLSYSYDIKAAENAVYASIELVKAAKKDMAPVISGDANFKYTGNPLRIELNIPAIGDPLSIRGQSLNYGAAISIMQPVYAGGKLLESIRRAKLEENVSICQNELVRAGLCLQSDLQYWNTVAMSEIMRITEDSYRTISSLTEIIRERVDVGIVDMQDLLMMQVKLNNADYQRLQARRNLDNSMMALNSLIGQPLENETEIDIEVPEVESVPDAPLRVRPEEKIAVAGLDRAGSDWKIADSRYKPQLYIGGEGLYSSPGYNLKSDIVPNYSLFAKLTVPICQWGRRYNEKAAYYSRIEAAESNLCKVKDDIRLEIQTARNSLSQAIDQVKLSRNSLSKAEENEAMAVDRYVEGKASVTELIDAQSFRLGAEMDYVNARAMAMSWYCSLKKAMSMY